MPRRVSRARPVTAQPEGPFRPNATSLPWTGITTGNTAACRCSWAYRAGRMEIKYRDNACPVSEHRYELTAALQ